MRAWYVDRRNEPILDMRMIVSFACALVLVLSWLLPREEFFRQMLAEGEADHVSIAYARLLAALNPADRELAGLLAAQYLQIGALERAWAAIAHDEDTASLLRAEILLRLTFSSVTDGQRGHWEALLVTELERAARLDELDENSALTFAGAAYAIRRPELAAMLFERRYLSVLQTDELIRAAAAWQSADHPQRAADLFLLVTDGGLALDPATARSERAVTAGLEAILAASRFADGFILIDSALAAGNTQPDMVVRYVEFAQHAGDPTQMRRYLALLGDVEGLSERQLRQLAGAAIGGGELQQAASLLETLLSRRPDDLQTRKELAEVYRWSGRPEAALEQWLELVERTGAEGFRSVAWRLALDLYRYGTAARILTDLSEQRRLSDEEVTALQDAYGLQGRPVAGISVLSAYLQAQPDHRQAWTLLIRLQQDHGDLRAATGSWADFARFHRLDIKERLRWADLLWQQYRTEEAVDLLLAAENSDHADYWRRLSAYAWFLDDMALAARSYAALSTLETLDRDHFDRFLLALMLTDPARAQRQALVGWRQFREPDYLLVALQRAVTAGDRELVASLLVIAEADRPALAGSARYWELLASYYQQQGDQQAVRRVLVSGLEHHPDQINLVSAYLWLLIQTADVGRLRDALARYQPLAETSPALWQAYAAALARLKEHRLALAWYVRAALRTPDDLALLLAYAGSLEAAGRGDAAFRMRRHVIAQIAHGQRSADTGLVTLTEAGRGVLTAQQAQALANWLVARQGGEELAAGLPRFYLAQTLQLAHYSAASYWLQRDGDPEVWQRLAMAMDQGDEPELEQLLDYPDPSVRINAALALDRPDLAYRDADNPLLGDEERLSLASTYYARYPTGWQVVPERSRISELNIDSLTFAGSGRVGTYWIGASVSGYLLSDELRLIPGDAREWLVEGHGGRPNGLGEIDGSISLLGAADELIPGFAAGQTFHLHRRHRLRVGGAYQQLTEITALARAVSQRSGLDLGWQSLLSRRDQFSVSASLDYYQDRFGHALGQGWQGEARFDHALSLSGPELLVGASLYATANTEQAPGSELLERLLIDRGELLLPDRTGRLALNASISRGSPGDPGWQLPGPRYRLGASLGYQWPESSPTLAFEASIGMRVLGNDELSLQTAYTSDLLSAVGGDGYRATLIYSKRLGR